MLLWITLPFCLPPAGQINLVTCWPYICLSHLLSFLNIALGQILDSKHSQWNECPLLAGPFYALDTINSSFSLDYKDIWVGWGENQNSKVREEKCKFRNRISSVYKVYLVNHCSAQLIVNTPWLHSQPCHNFWCWKSLKTKRESMVCVSFLWHVKWK
jgi:hypothetical protein